MGFYEVTLAPVPPEKIETSGCIFSSTVITFGADGSDWLIKFGALVTFCVLIYYLGVIYFT